ncbi:ran GTPase-activating protein 1a [Neolamprologus brichardi]|uniref:ran GTPase-activating protein 1a n=1 Tax=Neolamprologus brichardi TaxID=32507 RepID=UPI001643ACEF|nr:ran GTPase-activating protein 1a [Neolamprologus brichardi]
MATDDVAQLADSLAKTGVEDGELSYKGQGRKLDDAQSVEEMVKEIQDFEGLQALRLEGNTVGVEAAQAIAKALETKSALMRCYWSDMFTGRLRSEIPPALNSLGDALMLAGARLTVLDLSDNAFGPDGVKGIENLLKSSTCYTLQELRLNNCGMGVGGGKILAASLIYNHKKSSAAGSPLSLKVFQILSVSSQALKHLRSIQVINFGDCLVRPEGAKAIAVSVSEGLPILKELNLSYGEITEDAALVVAQAVKDKDQLEKLDLNGNCIGEDGCRALKVAMEAMNMSELLGSLSDDEGEPEDDDDDEEDDDDDEEEDDDEDDVDEEEVEEEEEEEEEEESTGNKFSTPQSAPRPPEVSSFLSFPSPDKLLKLGPTRALLIEQQVDVSDATKTAEAFLKIASVYKEDNTEVKNAVLDSIDGLLRKAFTSSSFQGYSFVSSLLVLLGLIKSEDKVKPVIVVPGHLQALEHVVRQDYFPKESVAVLEAFMSRNNKTLESCGNAKNNLQSTLQRVRSQS